MKETIAWAAVGWIGSFLITVSLPLGYFSTHPAVENAVVAVMQASLGFPMIALLNFMGATIAEKLISRKYSSREDT
ncbi:hypothetical protein [Burkholderia gladioli]|uniref:hypothetical protein n=1 Tax=Burkholderia gladioli TaxID=28095 RepID=UPI0011D201C8|nr:hypothetical protein [Burkholderia gladioli]